MYRVISLQMIRYILHFIIYNNNDVCFVLDQNAELDLYSATSLKQYIRDIFYLELPLYNGGAYHQGKSSGASILYKTIMYNKFIAYSL